MNPEIQEFWDTKIDEKDFFELALFLESTSEIDCPNDCLQSGYDYYLHDFNDVIAKGSFGITFRAESSAKEDRGKQFVIKLIFIKDMFNLQEAQNEFNFQEEVCEKMPDVVAMIETGEFCHPSCLREDQGVFTIVMQKLDKTFKQVLNELVAQDNADGLLREISKVVDLFHKFVEGGYIHRDAHSQNIMTLGLQPTSYRLIDFGFAEKIRPDEIEELRNIDAFFFVIRILCKDISNHWLLQKIRTSEDFCIKLAKILRRVSCTKKAQQRLGRMDSRSLPGTVDSFVTEFDNVFAKTRLYNYL
jgi:tRNA A-37 threonylcarbamoyl transferase component Bud32